MTFTEKLHARESVANSVLCVGLDPDIKRLPEPCRHTDINRAFTDFCCAIVDATAPYASCFKPQIAYFAAQRAEAALEAIIAYIHQKHPDIPVILDAKRGDIGSTAEQYAIEAFARYGADAVTVNPYMGFDSIEPYLQYPDKGVIVLCRTSNPGGSDLQFLPIEGKSRQVFELVAELAATQWNKTGQMALVVGATFPQELARVRALIGDMPLLIPGVGAQGGDVAATVQAAQTTNGRGMMINSSRAILYASAGADFAQAAAQEAQRTRDLINQFRHSR